MGGPDRTMPDPDPPPAPAAGPAHAAVMRVIAEVVRRRAAGELLPDAEVVAAHPGLAPDLAEELDGLRMVQRAFAAARRAGPICEPLAPVPSARLDDPIRADEGIAANDDDDDDSGAGDGGGAGPGPDRAGADRWVGRQAVPGYRVLREVIGTGGQAAVFKAVQESTGRAVAIKVLPGGPLAGAARRARFGREAEILAALDHPGVVPIVDRGWTADGSLYLVMPFVAGPPLDLYAGARRAEGAAGYRRVVAAFARLADAVGAAHAAGVVHRDVKPPNVLVDAGRDAPRLLDFGLARLTRADPAGGGGGVDWRARTVTVAGQVVGSLPWASPEQAAGGSAEAGPPADVYALGVCLYQALTGRHPYPLGGTIPELIDRIRTAAPRPVGRVPGFDGDGLQRVLDGCLAKRPADRYPTGNELAADLAAVLDGRPVARAAAPARPGRRGLAWGAAALVGLAGGAAWWLVAGGGRPAGPPVTVYDLPTATNSVGMTLVRLPPGEFRMGSDPSLPLHGDDERPHAVAFARPLWVATREVDRAQYAAVTGGPPPPAGEGGLPQTGVSFAQAGAFCRELSRREGRAYRLPTEAEWEYACRAGSAGAWAGGGDPGAMGWHAGNAGGRPHPTGGRAPNHWGLYDMHGNAAEWCRDAYQSVYPVTRTDPCVRAWAGRVPPTTVPSAAGGDGDGPDDDDAATGVRRVVRGGSYADRPEDTRSAARAKAGPRDPVGAIGFRVVRED